ncbi:hypothetical protein ACFLVV_02015 [Chloroflexota bacterium]
MPDIISEKLSLWTEGQNSLEARISVFRKIRDIPYAIIPEVIHPQKYLDILKINKGSCSPKHFLLADLLERLGLTIFYSVWQFLWKDIPIEWPLELKKLVEEMPINTHLALRVNIEDDFVLVDATLDPKLKILGLPINDWDGKSDTLLPIQPLGEEVWHSREEREVMVPNFEEMSLVFYQKLNSWMEKVRRGGRN